MEALCKETMTNVMMSEDQDGRQLSEHLSQDKWRHCDNPLFMMTSCFDPLPDTDSLRCHSIVKSGRHFF